MTTDRPAWVRVCQHPGCVLTGDHQHGASEHELGVIAAQAGLCSHGGHGWDGETCSEIPEPPAFAIYRSREVTVRYFNGTGYVVRHDCQDPVKGQRAEAGHIPAEMPGYPVTWQRDTLRRCEHLSRSAGMVAEFTTRTRYEYTRGNVAYADVVAYHCDRDCPEIRHETRPVSEWEPTISGTIRMLLDASARSRSDLCRRCVYLAGPAELAQAA